MQNKALNLTSDKFSANIQFSNSRSAIRLSKAELERDAECLSKNLDKWFLVPWVSKLVSKGEQLQIGFCDMSNADLKIVLTPAGFLIREREFAAYAVTEDEVLLEDFSIQDKERLAKLLLRGFDYKVFLKNLYDLASAKGVTVDTKILCPKSTASNERTKDSLLIPNSRSISCLSEDHEFSEALGFYGSKYYKSKLCQSKGIVKISCGNNTEYCFETNCGICWSVFRRFDINFKQRLRNFVDSWRMRVKRTKKIYVYLTSRRSSVAAAKLVVSSKEQAVTVLKSICKVFGTRGTIEDAIDLIWVDDQRFEFRTVFIRKAKLSEYRPKLYGHYSMVSRAKVSGATVVAGWSATTDSSMYQLVEKCCPELTRAELADKVKIEKNRFLDVVENFAASQNFESNLCSVDVTPTWSLERKEFDWWLIETNWITNINALAIDGMEQNPYMHQNCLAWGIGWKGKWHKLI